MNLTNDYVAYPKAMCFLANKYNARPLDIVAWIFCHELKAYVSINETLSPTEFNFAYWVQSPRIDYIALINQCWFLYDELSLFVPKDRYVTGKELIERWVAHEHIVPCAFIHAKINESRLTDMHPITGYTKASGECPDFFPPLEEALFAISEILDIENTDLNFEINKPVKPIGHLNHDPWLQEQANIIASEMILQTQRKPKKEDVAKKLKERINSHLAPESIVRRFNKEW